MLFLSMQKRVHFLTAIAALLVSLASFAQDKTTGRSTPGISTSSAKVLIVPYEPKMFISDVNRELTLANNMEIAEIRSLLRESLSQIIGNELSGKAKVIDLLNDGDEQYKKDLFEIYQAVNWEFITVELPDSLKNSKTGAAKTQVGRGSYVENGMIKTYYDGKDRFMNVVIADKNILSYIDQRFNPDYILFLNELDIKVRRDVDAYPGKPAPRQVKVHYSLLDSSGKKVSASAIMFDYPGDEKDIFKIIRSGFGKIAQDLRRTAFPTAPSTVSTGPKTK
jgi:hypothetical protein